MDLKNRFAEIFFYDGKGVSKRVGTIRSVDDLFIYIESGVGPVEAINKKRIVRMVIL